MTDRSTDESLRGTWLGIGARAAVASGAATAFVSLLFHVPLLAAVVRGTVVFFAVLAIVRICSSAMARFHARDAENDSSGVQR